MNAYIYKITNPNGKVYIGSTVDLKDRYYRYKTNRVKAQLKISRSIEKYGWDSQLFEVIFICSKEDKLFYENKYATLYDVLGENGLNLSIPKSEDIMYSLSNETRNKIGESHKGKKISDENKIKTSTFFKEWHSQNEHPMKGKTPWNKGKSFLVGEENPMYGVKRSKEWKENQSSLMKKIAKRGENNNKSKLIIDISTGIYFVNIREASEMLNVNYSTLKNMINGSSKNRTNLIYA
jgi:group I intron endonuclease